MKWFIVAAAATVALIPTQSLAMTEAECAAAWSRADTNKDGFISQEEGARYYAALRVSDKPLNEGRLSQADFMAHCKAGLFDARRVDAGAPLKGANSFTEGQARDRALSHGYTNVSQLVKDNDGIWRGSAQLDGKPIKVTIDYKGNVVGQ
jgi:hypothetical protein